jgi:hypothetical protein
MLVQQRAAIGRYCHKHYRQHRTQYRVLRQCQHELSTVSMPVRQFALNGFFEGDDFSGNCRQNRGKAGRFLTILYPFPYIVAEIDATNHASSSRS